MAPADIAAEQAKGNVIQVAFKNTTTGEWEFLDTVVNQQTGILSVLTSHFSSWTGLSETPDTTPAPTPASTVAPVEEDDKDFTDRWEFWLVIALATVILIICLGAIAYVASKKDAPAESKVATGDIVTADTRDIKLDAEPAAAVHHRNAMQAFAQVRVYA